MPFVDEVVRLQISIAQHIRQTFVGYLGKGLAISGNRLAIGWNGPAALMRKPPLLRSSEVFLWTLASHQKHLSKLP
jgi:hypothetical protein